MVLVDTSVWIDHLRRTNPTLVGLLESAQVVVHPFVVGELACGSLWRRRDTLELLAMLPTAPMAAHAEVLALVEHRRLWGIGIGWVDAHLLASARLGGIPLWTQDRRLRDCCTALHIAFE